MSGTNPDPTPSRRPEHTGGVVGTALCLLLVPLFLLSIFSSQGRAIDGEALFGQVFAGAELPHGYAVTGAGLLTGGDRLVVLERPLAVEVTDDAREVPERLCLAVYASPASIPDAMRRDMGDVPWRRRGRGGFDEDEGGGDDGPVSIQHGVLEWGGWSASFVHHRAWDGLPESEKGAGETEESEESESEENEETDEGEAEPADASGEGGDKPSWQKWTGPRREGPSRDTIRVNLSAGDRFCILYATWPADVHARPEWMEALLRRLDYTPPAVALAGSESYRAQSE